MELGKREIQNYTWKVKNTTQFTLDDTINVPENLLEMERLILVKGNIVVESTRAMSDRFEMKGSLNYQILYSANRDGNVFDSIEGKVPFIEYINAEGTMEGDYIEIHACLNDLTVTMLHSRKVSLKALISIDYQIKESEQFEAITDITGENNAEVLHGAVNMVSLQLQKKENVRIEEQVEIPSNKPNIYQVIWKSMTVTKVQIKPADGYLLASGTLSVFLIYTAEDEDMPLQYCTMEVPFEKRVEEDLSNEDMISGSFLSLDQYRITVNSDQNGEDRVLDIMADFMMEMKLYGNEELKLVKDAYATNLEMNPKYKTFMVQHLLLRNCAKTKISDTITMPKNQEILQICNVDGSVSIDETTRSAKGIEVEGVLATQIIYMNKEEGGILSSITFDVPFSYEIEVAGKTEDMTYSIIPFIDQIQIMQVNESQMDMKAEISLEVLAFTNEKVNAVLDMEIKPIDIEKKREMPGLIGYIVKKDDTLWSIAKTYYTTVEKIRRVNELETDDIKCGDRLIVLKD